MPGPADDNPTLAPDAPVVGGAGPRETARVFCGMLALVIVAYLVGSTTVFKLYYVVTAVALLATMMLLTPDVPVIVDSWPIGLFNAYLPLTALWALVPEQALVAGVIHFIAVPVWMIAYVAARQGGIKRLSKLAVALPYLVAAMFIWTYTQHGTLRPGLMGAAYDEIGSIAARGMWFTCVPIPLIMWRLIYRRSPGAAAALVLCVGTALWAESRAGIVWTVVLTVATAVALAPSGKIMLRRVAYMAVGGAVLAGGVMVTPALQAPLADRTQRLRDTVFDLDSIAEAPQFRARQVEARKRRVNEGVAHQDQVDHTATPAPDDYERKLMYFEGYQSFLRHPVRGIGYQNLREATDEAYGIGVVSHSLVITLLAELGIPGTVLFAVLIGGYFHRLRIARARAELEATRMFIRACGLAMLACLLLSMTQPMLASPMYFALLGAGYGLGSRATRALQPGEGL